jgi:maltooligosyltrehalose trehalohydrolase
MPTWRLVVCNQNHDQIGNRARGDRLSDPAPGHLDDDQLACAALLTLTGPFTPMLFQGEEWGASTPFQFFTSHPEEELGRATAEGRITEFAEHGWDPATVPDPQDPETFRRSKLDWTELESERGRRLLGVYRDLAALRRRLPDLTDPRFTRVECAAEDAGLFTMQRGDTLIAVNFGSSAAEVSLDPGTGDLLFTTPSGATYEGGVLTLPPHAGALIHG